MLLLREGAAVRAGMRNQEAAAARRLEAAGVEIVHADLEKPASLIAFFAGADAAILTPILTQSIAALPFLDDVDRLVFFSSNNVAVAPDDPVYAAIAAAETRIRAHRPDAAILRPTLLYGDRRLPAITALMRVMNRMPIMPVPGGRARQQPLFFEDAARVAVEAPKRGLRGTFALGGPEIFSLTELYRRVSRAIGGARLVLPTPRTLLAAAQAAGVPMPISRAELARADLPKVAVPVDPLPADLKPATSFSSGLVRLLEEAEPAPLAAQLRPGIETQ